MTGRCTVRANSTQPPFLLATLQWLVNLQSWKHNDASHPQSIHGFGSLAFPIFWFAAWSNHMARHLQSEDAEPGMDEKRVERVDIPLWERHMHMVPCGQS